MPLTLLGLVLGVVVFVVLILAVSPFWVAGIIGVGVVLVFSLLDLAIQIPRSIGRSGGAY
jgi:hypothetical protein